MKTKRILTSQAIPGMIIADDVYTFNNQLIISKDSTLTSRNITRLKFYSINDIRIVVEDENASAEKNDTVLQDNQSDENSLQDIPTYTEYVKKTPEFKKFNRKFINTIKPLESTLTSLVNDRNKAIDTSEMLNETSKILSDTRNGIHVFHILQSMRNYDDLTFAHSLSVSLICNVMGGWLKFSPKDTEVLTLAGLLHDIGKILVPREILTKPGKLTDDEFTIIKNHPQLGYNTLKNQKLDRRIKYAVLMHHERCDGSGYPSSLLGPQIDDFAKIMAIADTYEAMTAPRVYRAALCPFDVIRLFESEGLQKFDPHFLLTFLEGMARTYIDHSVKLNNGMEGSIVMINTSDLSRPLVKTQDDFIDLSKHTDLQITAIL